MKGAVLQVRPSRPEPLAQVEVLLLFNRRLQTSPTNPPPEAMQKAAHMWLTVDVFGQRGVSELTGKPCIENMWMASRGEDVTALLEPMADEIANYLTEE